MKNSETFLNQTAVMPETPKHVNCGYRSKIMHLLGGLLLLATEGCATLSVKTVSEQDIMRRSEAVARSLGGEIGVDDNRTTIINCETGPEPMELLRELEELNSRVLPGSVKDDIATEPLDTDKGGMVKKWLACLRSAVKSKEFPTDSESAERTLPAPVARPVPVTDPQSPEKKNLCGFNNLEQAVFEILNKERVTNGTGPLACDPIVTKIARAHSQDMCRRKFFSHTNPEGFTPLMRLIKGGAVFSVSGENIAFGHVTPERVHIGWMNSKGHRENILERDFEKVGIGYEHCDGRPLWTQLFIK